MATVSTQEDEYFALKAKVTLQASVIKQMKKEGAPADAIAAEVQVLGNLREQLFEMAGGEKPITEGTDFNRKGFDELLLRKMYVVPSFEIHNGPAGLFDYGPAACALKANILALWRQHFVLEENMLEMECTNLTPSSVLETSGHVERFTDFMVRDVKSGECFRADKLLEDAIDNFLKAHPNMPPDEQEEHRIVQRQADAFTAEELHAMLIKYNVKSPSNPDNDLTTPFPFNLMFKTTIGPEGTSVGYLRPETAQGLFVNFRRLLDYNQQRMPFAAAQIGLGFRNEIAPRNGLLRVREFCMAEIEHFVNPKDKRHPKFSRVAGNMLTLFPADAQLGSGKTVSISIGEAVSSGMVNNETLGYFMARTHSWLVKIGVDPKKMRFRQHLKTEMAHYSSDCWDMEIQMSYGWIECVGHADRACYDLTKHGERTGVSMVAAERLLEPMNIDKIVCEPNKKLLGPRFKGDQKVVTLALESLEGSELEQFKAAIDSVGVAEIRTASGASFSVTADLVSFKSEKKTIWETKYTPGVIEPSYGIGRIIYAVLEHSFSQRNGDEQRCVMSFKPCVAPIKVGVFRLLNNSSFDPIVNGLRDHLMSSNIATRVDSSSGSLGKRYARADELGIPFGITVDFQTLLDNTVTLRDRNTMAQVRLPLSTVAAVIRSLVAEEVDWSRIMSRYVVVNDGGNDADEAAGDSGASSGAPSVVSTAPTVLHRTYRGSFSRPNPNFKASA